MEQGLREGRLCGQKSPRQGGRRFWASGLSGQHRGLAGGVATASAAVPGVQAEGMSQESGPFLERPVYLKPGSPSSERRQTVWPCVPPGHGERSPCPWGGWGHKAAAPSLSPRRCPMEEPEGSPALAGGTFPLTKEQKLPTITRN